MSGFGNIFLSREDVASLNEPPAKKIRLEPEYAEVYQKWKTQPSETNRDRMLSSLSPIIDRAVGQIQGDKNYLTVRGKILAMQAMDKYDPSVSSLSTYLSSALLPLRRYARSQMNILNVPERTMLLSTQLEGAETELEDELGRPPTTSELADKMGMSVKSIEKARRSSHARNSGTYETPMEEGDVHAPIVTRNIPERYQHDYVLSRFSDDPISTFIYENDFQLNGRRKLSTADLAKRLKITSGAVSQRRQKIFETLNTMAKYLYD